MLLQSLIALGVSALAVASPTKRAQALQVSVSAPENVDSIKDLKLTASVTNSGAEDVKVLKYGTVLDGDLPTRSFRVSKDGTAANFTGVKLQLDLTKVGDALVTIPAGQTLKVDHDVSSLFDFEPLGTGAYTFEPITTFQVFSGNDTRSTTRAKFSVAADKVNVNINKDVAKRALIAKRATVDCSDTSESSFIQSSYSEGQSLASLAADYVNSNGADDLFTSYFHSTDPSTVADVFNNVATEDDSSRTLNCADPYDACGQGTIAYTVTSTTDIYFCDIFYDEVSTDQLCSGTSVADRNIRGGTTLHELTHATSGTEDVQYGCSSDQSLSASEAAENADSYNCFATQVYANTKC